MPTVARITTFEHFGSHGRHESSLSISLLIRCDGALVEHEFPGVFHAASCFCYFLAKVLLHCLAINAGEDNELFVFDGF